MKLLNEIFGKLKETKGVHIYYSRTDCLGVLCLAVSVFGGESQKQDQNTAETESSSLASYTAERSRE